MHVKRGLFCLLIFCAVFQSKVHAQARDAFEAVRCDWHLAGISEYEGLWQNAISYYEKAVVDSRLLPVDVHEWYRGTAYYGIARCLSHASGNQQGIRNYLSRAFAHHFWNFALINADTGIVSQCGELWLDSCSRYWNGVAKYERPLWREQVPIVFYPKGYDSTARWPLVIALHGGNGNYQSFAEHWMGMATRLGAVIVVPAGSIRESQITNSWGSDMSVVSQTILSVVNEFTSKHLVNPAEIYLSGFSQGAQAAIELTLLRPDIFRGAIAMSGFVDHSFSDSILRKARRNGVRLYEITGQYEDPTFDEEIDSVHKQCVRMGIPFKLNISPGMIHEVPLDFPSQLLRAWSWVQLQPEAARAEK